jgi:hypothetical protein
MQRWEVRRRRSLARGKGFTEHGGVARQERRTLRDTENNETCAVVTRTTIQRP